MVDFDVCAIGLDQQRHFGFVEFVGLEEAEASSKYHVFCREEEMVKFEVIIF